MISQIIIPARLASTRLAAEAASGRDRQAADSAYLRIGPAGPAAGRNLRGDRSRRDLRAVQAFGGRAEMTDPACRQRHRSRGRSRPPHAGRRHHRQRPGRRARDRRQFDRSGHRTSRLAPRGPDVDAGHAHPQPAAIGRPGLREGRLRRPAAGPCTSAAAPFRGPASGTTPCWRPTRRTSISTWGCTPIAANFS